LNESVTWGGKRTKILEQFRLSKDITVLLLSNVGTTGINLASANILIIMVGGFNTQN
jgi:SNF2 family DNA or RNA helicase